MSSDQHHLWSTLAKKHDSLANVDDGPWTREALVAELDRILKGYGDYTERDFSMIYYGKTTTAEMLNLVVQNGPYNVQHNTDGRIQQTVEDIANSNNVMLCYSDVITSVIDMNVHEHFDESLIIEAIVRSGWKMVSYGDKNCIPIGNKEHFLLVRDTTDAKLKEFCAILAEAYGDEARGVSFDHDMRLEGVPTLFDVTPWRQFILGMEPMQTGHDLPDREGTNNILPETWTNSLPMWTTNTKTNKLGTPTLTITHSKHGLLILNLLDGAYKRIKSLVQLVADQACEIENLKQNIDDLKEEYRQNHTADHSILQ